MSRRRPKLQSHLPKEAAAGPKGMGPLDGLALDMHWSWNHGGDELWHRLDPELWERTHNPWVVLQTVSKGRLERVLRDRAFRDMLAGRLRDERRAAKALTWFQRHHPESPLRTVAYFSMEYMLSEALPIYSGGLGNVAGDQLKSASDLGVPVVGVGLLYQRGYFRQVIDKMGSQQALFPYNDPGQLPVAPLRETNGEWLRLEIPLPGTSVWLRAWQVQVGRAKLFLLDSNDVANFPAHRGIVSELYGGGPETRLKQELVLGIGGCRLLAALGIEPEVFHLNEGHAAFAVLERARLFMKSSGKPFEVALAVTRAGNLFTTHTSVPAGFDRFPSALIEQYLGNYAEDELGIDRKELLALGRRNPNDPSESFNMAYLAVRGSGAVNGVSRLHGEVSRQLFAPLFPRWPLDQVPVGFVTNGIHVPSWDSAEADELWTGACGKDRWHRETETHERDIRSVPDGRLWELRNRSRGSLVAFARERLRQQLQAIGAPAPEVEEIEHWLDPRTLTLGFARRFATYKRPNLLLHEPERLLRLLSDKERPVQLIIAGKAHPADEAGQALIREWTRFVRRPEARGRTVFLSDYDMLLTERIVQGVDVWINTPRRPWEACGTSGMKVLVNGGLNLSELDGWWAEAFSPELGWSLGDGGDHGDDPAWDAEEANALYQALEEKVVPEFYDRDGDGLPRAWVARLRESMARLTPCFSANRTVREYTEEHYLPAAARFAQRSADESALGARLTQWRHELERNWGTIGFGEVRVRTEDGHHLFEVEVDLGALDPDAVRVEIYADPVDDAPGVRQEMVPASGPLHRAGAGVFLYRARVTSSRPQNHFTARIIPHHSGAPVPLEASWILWQR